MSNFEATPAVRGEEPLSIGMVGPPGGGKTFSALRIATGMQRVRGGDIIVIDTEGGRARKLADHFKFLHVDFEPPHRSDRFLQAIDAQLSRNPACVIVDSMSDEHEGIGGYLEWHDAEVSRMGGNEWAAWAKPKAARKRLITGIIPIKTPLIFTFRAREKTAARPKPNGKTEIISIGWQPVAPLEIVHSIDVICILPPRADGVPVWRSDKVGEDFIIKLPEQFRTLLGGDARQLDESIGMALAEWARGGVAPVTRSGDGVAVECPSPSTAAPDSIEAWLDYRARLGTDELKLAWMNLRPAQQKKWKSALEQRWKPIAQAVDDRNLPTAEDVKGVPADRTGDEEIKQER